MNMAIRESASPEAKAEDHGPGGTLSFGLGAEGHGIATAEQGEQQRMLILLDIEQLMSSAEMGLMQSVAP